MVCPKAASRDVPAVNYKEMRSSSEPESSATLRERVIE
jgi:hypothetical protein